MFRRSLALSCAALLTLLGVLGSSPTAAAAPPTAAWSATAGGDVANVGLSVTGLTLANARLANSSAASSSTASPRSQSISRNIAAAVAGLPIAVASNSQTAPPDNAGPVAGNLAAVSAVGIGVGALSTVNEAHWAGDAACVTASPQTAATTTTAGLSVNPLGLVDLLTTGVSSTTGTTSLVSSGGGGLNRSVQSQARGSIAGVSVLGGAVTVEVAGQAVLTATAAGTAGNAIVAYTAPIVRVTEGGNTQTVALGSNVTLDLGVVGSVQVSVNNPTVTTAANGTSATATVNTVSLVIRAGPAALPVANAAVQLIPLRASAVVPSGGIDCPPPAPVLSQPANGSLTNDSTPTYSGTGVAGATIDLTVDGTTTTNVATVTGGGTWTYTPTATLTEDDHTASATQTLNGSTSAASNQNTFTVDTTPPAAPVVVQPANNSRTNDDTPTLSGTGPASTTIRLFVDGSTIGTTTTNAAGNWQVTSASLPDGSHTVYAVAVDAAGNNSAQSNTNTFVVDTDVPPPPVITAPANGSTIATATPTVTGTGEPGATVAVSIDGTQRGTTTVSGGGTWSFPITAALAEGPHTAGAQQTDAAGNTSTAASNNFIVDLTAPAAPVVTTPANGSTTGASPTVRGTAEANATVEVFIDGASVGTTTASGAGVWQLPVPTPLATGPHQVYAVATDAAGNVSPQSNTNTFTVDTTAPAAPVLQTPANGSTTNDTTPSFSGTAEAGATVEVFVDGASIGTTTATGGAFSLDATVALGDGPHSAYVIATDAAGNASPRSNTNTFTVDGTAPVVPVITAPANGSTITDTTPTVTGTGEPGATVAVTIDGTPIGNAPVNAAGNWSVPVLTALGEGPHTASAVQTDPAGNTSPAATSTFTIDTTPPAVPVVVTPANGATTGPSPTIVGTSDPSVQVEVFLDGNSIGTVTATAAGSWQLPVPTPLASGAHEVYATAADAVGNVSGPSNTNIFTVDADAPAAPVLQAPANGSTTNDTTPTFSGTAEAGSTVEVFVDGASIGTTVATGGTFSLDATTPLGAGPHDAYVIATDAAGNASPQSDTNTFTIDLTAPGAPTITAPADGSTIADSTPTVTGTGESGATVAVSIDGTPIGTAPVNAAGNWSLPVGTALGDGPHTASAVQTDPAGNTSPAATSAFTVDTIAPGAPVIDAPADGSSINDTTPDVTGTGVSGAVVTVTLDGSPLGTATVTGAGTWSIPVTSALDEGPHTATATQADEVGNESPAATSTFTVDTTDPATPVIVSPADGSTTNDSTPTVSGRGEPGATIVVTIDSTPVGNPVVVGSDGTWSVQVTAPLSEDSHTASATQTDPAGNVSAADTVTFTVDLTAPAAPVVVTPADGSTTGDSTPTISGTAEPGATVEVFVDGTSIGSVTASGTGAWQIQSPGLTNGSHTVFAGATDAAGNDSPPSATNTFTVADQTAPAAPVITSPRDGAETRDTTPTITGTAEPGSTVTVIIDEQPVGTAPVESNGQWSFTPTTPLGSGDHEITATAADGAGNVSGQAERVTVTVVDIADPVITSPTPGSETGSEFQVCGTGEPGAQITLLDQNGDSVATAVVGTDGTWCADVDLAPGTYVLTARQSVEGLVLTSTPITITVASDSDSGTGTGTGSGTGGLANTGGPALGLGVLGALLLAAGTTVLIRRRRVSNRG